MFALVREAYALVKKQKAERVERLEKAAIAKAFNDRYTYRKPWVKGLPRLPGSGMFGITPEGGYAWMCPECNRIHHPVESSVFSGIQYPACCRWPEGHRFYDEIRTT
ncbi:MAG: hypothetical protein P4L11_13595 [Geothrix sp.]|nr:hypothetical protein [Geothrix sp.]